MRSRGEGSPALKALRGESAICDADVFALSRRSRFNEKVGQLLRVLIVPCLVLLVPAFDAHSTASGLVGVVAVLVVFPLCPVS